MILDILFALLVIIGLCCVVVTQDYVKEVNDKIEKELQE